MNNFKQFKQLRNILVKVLYRGVYIKVYEITTKPFKPLKMQLGCNGKQFSPRFSLLLSPDPDLIINIVNILINKQLTVNKLSVNYA